MNKRRIPRNAAGLLAAGIMLLSPAGCMPKESAGREPVFAVNVMPAAAGNLIDYLEVNGDIEASSTIDVYPDKAGEIIRIDVTLGQRVAAGQVIARIDPSRPGQRYEPNPVTAPIAGTITSLPIRLGGSVSLASLIAKISRTNDLIIVTNVAERFVAKMKTGLDAAVSLDAFPGELFPATVTEVSPVVDPVSRSLGIKLAFTGPTDRIKAGMFAEIRIITGVKKNVIRIPFNAIVRMEGKSYVFVAREAPADQKPADASPVEKKPADAAAPAADRRPVGVAEKREVVTGLIVDDKVEIKSGVTAEEKVVVAGQKSLDDKAKIRIIEELPGYPVQDTISGGGK